MKLFFDLFPVLLFFIAYKMFDIYVATGVIIVASMLQTSYSRIRHGKFERMHLITLAVVLVFGGLTLALRNPVFIKWKPSIVNWALAAAFLGSEWIGGKNLVRRMMEKSIVLPEELWTRLNVAWVGFFIICGAANLAVAFTCTEDTWVNFKLFGLTGLSFLFVIGQALAIRNYVQPVEETVEDRPDDA